MSAANTFALQSVTSATPERRIFLIGRPLVGRNFRGQFIPALGRNAARFTARYVFPAAVTRRSHLKVALDETSANALDPRSAASGVSGIRKCRNAKSFGCRWSSLGQTEKNSA